ncbi:hypothetical protein GCM10011411_01920 [Aurantiacibacter arachoides]|uniref:DDE-type integrase/transposase/recombinase n=1 Tax=Aurantiacibacter arachoides TaxID=1850444 RepID=UPI0019BE9902|nr:DDE-type integrase/transposase/recombinase [Aurantiacibacter arachoides]GGD45921.1 hypothetical protein GCM10011411_01920 [Aurantiacibacter arachoides]
MKKALRRHGTPAEITTDGLRSYQAAMTELGNTTKREVGRWANNRVENSHLLFRLQERAMLRFRQMKSLQKFASVHANVHKHFNLARSYQCPAPARAEVLKSHAASFRFSCVVGATTSDSR